MDNLAHADIFFFVTTIAVGVLTIGFAVVIFYLVKLLAGLNGIVSDARAELATVTEYMDDQMKNSQSKLAGVTLVAEGLMRLYGAFGKPNKIISKRIVTKRKKS